MKNISKIKTFTAGLILCILMSSCGIIIKGADGMKAYKHKKINAENNKFKTK